MHIKAICMHIHVCPVEALKFIKTPEKQNLILQNPKALFRVKLILM